MITTLDELERLFKMCRKAGITALTLKDISFNMTEAPPAKRRADAAAVAEPDPANPYENFPTGDLTPEQLMFYSSGGRPEDDPENEEMHREIAQ